MSKIEEHIRRAMEEGRFNNLPGKGKPLRLEDNPLEDPEWRMANHILRTSGFTLPWIETRREIEADLEDARSRLARTWNWHQKHLAEGTYGASVRSEWEQSVKRFQEEIDILNKQIVTYNLEVPSTQLQRRLINSGNEIARLTTAPLSDTL